MTQNTSTQKPAYEQELDALFAHYEQGKKVFINARDWDDELKIKPESQKAIIPQNWLELVEHSVGVIARGKYGIDAYPNVIQIIDAQQMLNAYASVGMPISYDHWSFGRDMIKNEKAYGQGEMGLAYEIVINSNPTIAYCMTQNSKTMQILVIAHASYGHNSFFKNNHLFKQFTNATDIVSDLERLKHFVDECKEKYGSLTVERFMDAAHALESHGVDRYNKPKKRNPEEEKALRYKLLKAAEKSHDDVMDRTLPRSNNASKQFKDSACPAYQDLGMEENLLSVIAGLSPHLEDWQRKLLRMVSDKAQYFYPQKQTQLMNEGWATFWHYTLLNDMYDLDLMSDGMMLEFLKSHTSVVAQPTFDSPYYSGINVYSLGFEMYRDIKRICEKPTEEDRRWFPDFAGNPDWLSVVKGAAEDYKDESFVEQFLSPHLMRKFRLFTIENDAKETTMSVASIHDDDGYRSLRRELAGQYRLGDREPRIEAARYYFKKDRTLLLQHIIHNDRPLEEDNAKQVLQHIHALWGHPVVLQSVTPEGDIINTLGCPKISSAIDKGMAYDTVEPR